MRVRSRLANELDTGKWGGQALMLQLFKKSETHAFSNTTKTFLIARRVEGVGYKHLKWFEYILGSFAKYLSSDVSITSITTNSIREYLALLTDKKLSRSTIADHQRGLRTFFKWCIEEGLIHSNPGAPIQKIKLPKQFPKLVSEDDVEKILKACDSTQYEGIRNYAMILFFVDCGIRLSELISLTPNDINILNRSIIIQHGKGGKSRMAFIGKRTAIALRKWLEIRHKAPEEPLFCTKRGEALKARHVLTITHRLAKKAGITAKVSPHRLRHTAATMMAKAGMNAFELAQLLGHSDVKTTMIYTHLGGMALREAHARASPADKLFQ